MKRPYMVEIFGTPEAGKTTVIKEVIKSLSQKGYKTHYVQESAEVVPAEFKKGSIEAHIWMRLNTTKNIMLAKECEDDIILIDRGIWDTLFWNGIFYQRGALSLDKLMATNQFMSSIDIFPHLTCILITEVEEAIARRGGEGRIVTREFIANYNENLVQFQEKIFPPPIVVDTTKKSELEVFQYMESLILQHYEQRI